jgi:hypothetical protein
MNQLLCIGELYQHDGFSKKPRPGRTKVQGKDLCVKASFFLNLYAKAHKLSPISFSILFHQGKTIHNKTHTLILQVKGLGIKKAFPLLEERLCVGSEYLLVIIYCGVNVILTWSQ